MSKMDLHMGNTLDFTGKKYYVKFMVSLRCKLLVKSEMDNLGLTCKFSPYGALVFHEEISQDQLGLLRKNLLEKSCLVLLNESESMLVDKIINTIIEVVHYSDTLPKLNFTDLINKHTIAGGESLLKIFSDVTGMSVLQFIVKQKIERTKELLLYEDMPLSEIADSLNYKNKHYLVAQFKKVTGLSPYYFKRLKKERMKIAEQAAGSAKVSA